tara:strand:- start:712 stop:897 length:186 start_codon:yes stop_codon:yes gene_type:complete
MVQAMLASYLPQAGAIAQTLLCHLQLEPLVVSIAHKNTPKVGLDVQLSGCSSLWRGIFIPA